MGSKPDRHRPSGVRGLEGRPGFRRRTDRLRRGPPPPHSGWHAAWPPEAPEGASLEPGRSPARRPLHLVATGPKAGLARPEAAEAPSKPLQLFRPKNPRVPGLPNYSSVEPKPSEFGQASWRERGGQYV